MEILSWLKIQFRIIHSYDGFQSTLEIENMLLPICSVYIPIIYCLHVSRIMRKPSFAHAKTVAQISFAVTAKLISAFVFTTGIVQFFYFLNPKFPASSHLLFLYSSACVRPVWKPHCWFSHDSVHLYCFPLTVPLNL